MTAPTLAELVSELRGMQMSPEDIHQAKANSARPEHTGGYIAGRQDVARLLHAFEERLIEGWHEKGCACGHMGAEKCGECGAFHLTKTTNPSVDARCAEARRTAREGR